MVHILGIRHHGVGSAAMVQKRLEQLKPDLIFIEGATEIESVLPYVGHTDLKPPLAIMLYDEEDTSKYTFYPFAEFSPEWVASKFANEHKIRLKALDLPAKISLTTYFSSDEPPKLKSQLTGNEAQEIIHRDPMSYLALIAGFEDSEKWWDYQFEISVSEEPYDYFRSTSEAIRALRDEKLPSALDNENAYREAYMRELIRQAQNELYQNIVVICGAWHAPALEDLEGQDKSDAKLLKQLPKVKNKIAASWIPWTNSRLSLFSGYGAGIQSPGWYDHLWSHREKRELAWLAKVAELFRKEGQDISTAHVLETYRLSLALSQLRNKSSVTLDEMNEAIITVMCMGDSILLELVKRKMIVGDKIGTVPDDIPKAPLQEDFEQQLKTLRLKLSALPTETDLDLRQEAHLKKSIFFHRLNLLNIQWAKISVKRSKGTFKESWTLIWSPEMMLQIIDNAYLGNTIEAACNQKIGIICAEEQKITIVVAILNQVLPANLEHSIPVLLNKIDELSTISSEIQDIMDALPELIQIHRYGDVRKSDVTVLTSVIDRLINKVIINLPNACYGLNDDISNSMFERIAKLHYYIKLTENSNYIHQWHQTLGILLDKEGVHQIIRGCVCRMMLDAELLSEEESARRLSYSLSTSHQAIDVAYWIEGFLRGSGMILIYDNRLWNLLYQWLDELDNEQFVELLPYLRRAFSKFEFGERRQIGEKAKKGLVGGTLETKIEGTVSENDFLPIFQTLDYLTGRV